MKLKVYLAEQEMTLTEFASTLGVNVRYLSRIMNGHIYPGKRLMRDISNLTKGKVNLEKPAGKGKNNENN